MKKPAAWTRAAARLPLAFALVREDPQIDLALLEGLGHDARVVMIASGGDTAALLVAAGAAAHLRLVDANPAQLALTRLKLLLLRSAPPAVRAAVLGHRWMSPSHRAELLAELRGELSLPEDVFGRPAAVARVGPDRHGRYEALFRELWKHLAEHCWAETVALTGLADPAEQARRVAPGTALRAALDAAFDEVMSLPNLVALFGAEATRNPAREFSRHFADRTAHALATFPARTNFFLMQALRDFCHDTGLPDWLARAAPARWPEIVYTPAAMVDALRALPEGQTDFVHLSNILDWLSPEAAAGTLTLACRVLRPGGLTVVRQLNSSLDIPPLGPGFDWQDALAADWHRRDRSFFYRALHIGRKP